MEASVHDRELARGRTADAPDPTRDETAQAQTSRVVETKPVTADPGPLGLAAFALTTFVLSIFNSGLMSEKGLPIVLGLALAYGGLAQLLAGMWEFRTGNTFGAVAFTSYGAFWLSFWAFEQFYAKDITDKVALGNSVGLFLIGWGIFTAYMFIASLRTTVAISVVFFLLATTFIVLGIGDAEANKSITHVGGYIGIATAIAAWYASFAAVTNSTFGRTVLPVKELKR
jgi:succinate-acetate transporter protein